MLLSFQPLEDFASVNQFRRVDSWRLNSTTSPTTLYFQLTDVSKEPAGPENRWPGLRYIPASGSYLIVNLHNINDALNIKTVAYQPVPYQDPSIWAISLADVKCVGTPDILMSLTENSTPGIVMPDPLPTPPTYPGITLTAVGQSVTITLTGGATFATLPAAGSQIVIGVDSDLYLQAFQWTRWRPWPYWNQYSPFLPFWHGNNGNGGFYLVTGTSTSTQITATKVGNLFASPLTAPQSVGVVYPIHITNTGDIRVGPTLNTTTGITQGKLRIQTLDQYAVRYRSPYSDINDDGSGFLSGGGQGGNY
jgi:hypothetical protein